ncbi:MAG: PhzF family phenazine biosynthesis protein, partial [Pseudomonadales bacterium]|nr:PhzF family phenazine biosynthesis protein [Pseudomonadales bacterium]
MRKTLTYPARCVGRGVPALDKRFIITEVFSDAPYGGNQLATLPDAGGMTTKEMQQIARAFNFAETT